MKQLCTLVLKKGLRDDQIREAASILNKVGIPFFTYNMMGLPGECLQGALKTLGMNIDIRTKCEWITWQHYGKLNICMYAVCSKTT
jgi:radical SAM superfamily enzyme YgiQ (UPF0313 family)